MYPLAIVALILFALLIGAAIWWIRVRIESGSGLAFSVNRPTERKESEDG